MGNATQQKARTIRQHPLNYPLRHPKPKYHLRETITPLNTVTLGGVLVQSTAKLHTELSRMLWKPGASILQGSRNLSLPHFYRIYS